MYGLYSTVYEYSTYVGLRAVRTVLYCRAIHSAAHQRETKEQNAKKNKKRREKIKRHKAQTADMPPALGPRVRGPQAQDLLEQHEIQPHDLKPIQKTAQRVQQRIRPIEAP